jgi:malate dehydrogenase
MGRNKITVVGGGHVGATTAQRIAEKELGDVVLVDIVEGLPQGKTLDMAESAPIEGFDAGLKGSNSYEETKGSDIVVVTAGIPRKPGMSRDDLLATNAKIMKSVISEIAKYSPDAILIIVSNPLDAMTYIAKKVSNFPKERVMGMAGILDSARFRAFIAMELNVSYESVHAMVLGGHGDSMVPLPQYSTVAGISIPELIPADKIEQMVDRTRKGGGEIVSLLKTGSAYYAPSAASVEMVESIIKNKRKVLPCAALLGGEYGIDNLFIGVPVILGSNGIEKIIELKLTGDQADALKKSADAVQKLVNEIEEKGLV